MQTLLVEPLSPVPVRSGFFWQIEPRTTSRARAPGGCLANIWQGQDSGFEQRIHPMGRNFTFLRRLLSKRPGRQRRLAMKNRHGGVRGFADIPARRLIDPGKLESGL